MDTTAQIHIAVSHPTSAYPWADVRVDGEIVQRGFYSRAEAWTWTERYTADQLAKMARDARK